MGEIGSKQKFIKYDSKILNYGFGLGVGFGFGIWARVWAKREEI